MVHDECYSTLLLKASAKLAKILPEKLGNAISFRWLSKVNAKGKVVTEIYPGIYMDLDLSDWLQKLYYLGFIERQRLDFVKSLIPRGGTFIDVGANVGLYSCVMANHVGFNGSVIAFEPMPECLDQLHSNVKLNKLQNVTIHPVALSNQIGEIDLYVPPKHPGGPSGATQVWNPGDWKTAGSASSTKLDAVFHNDRLDFIKIDVQGHEIKVLEGAQKVIQQFHPLVLCEVEKYNCVDILEFAENYEYSLFVENDGYLKLLPELKWSESEWIDLFLIPKKANSALDTMIQK